jgi:hypothetical protein
MTQILFALYLHTTLGLEFIGDQKETAKGEAGYREFEP